MYHAYCVQPISGYLYRIVIHPACVLIGKSRPCCQPKLLWCVHTFLPRSSWRSVHPLFSRQIWWIWWFRETQRRERQKSWENGLGLVDSEIISIRQQSSFKLWVSSEVLMSLLEQWTPIGRFKLRLTFSRTDGGVQPVRYELAGIEVLNMIFIAAFRVFSFSRGAPFKFNPWLRFQSGLV